MLGPRCLAELASQLAGHPQISRRLARLWLAGYDMDGVAEGSKARETFLILRRRGWPAARWGCLHTCRSSKGVLDLTACGCRGDSCRWREQQLKMRNSQHKVT